MATTAALTPAGSLPVTAAATQLVTLTVHDQDHNPVAGATIFTMAFMRLRTDTTPSMPSGPTGTIASADLTCPPVTLTVAVADSPP